MKIWRSQIKLEEGQCTSFDYDIVQNHIFIENLQFQDRSRTLPIVMAEIDRLAQEKKVKSISLFLRNHSERWPAVYGYHYRGQRSPRHGVPRSTEVKKIDDFVYYKYR